MRQTLLLILVFLLWPAGLWAQSSSAAGPAPGPDGSSLPAPAEISGPQPKIVLAETEFDAGDNPPGSSVTHDFAVRNEGEGELTLEAVPGCGCTVANYDRTIKPGGSGVITMIVDLYDIWAGRKVNKAVTVTTNDPALPLVRLVMHAQVEAKKPAAEEK
ncbi:MAG: DUF1573 domain-containing protein [Deltaproteobacteria bacterium]|jgi:hypothetical protein|nr:DUF1573 domain-containing protein [Deltaproteobacteria bacterium]